MGELPSIELLESAHHFPGPYIFKAIGRADNGFVGRVVAAVRDELSQPTDPPYSFRQTLGGRHVAVTLEPTVQTARQVLDVYRRIRKVVGVVLLL